MVSHLAHYRLCYFCESLLDLRKSHLQAVITCDGVSHLFYIHQECGKDVKNCQEKDRNQQEFEFNDGA
mgnify:CR=1